MVCCIYFPEYSQSSQILLLFYVLLYSKIFFYIFAQLSITSLRVLKNIFKKSSCLVLKRSALVLDQYFSLNFAYYLYYLSIQLSFLVGGHIFGVVNLNLFLKGLINISIVAIKQKQNI